MERKIKKMLGLILAGAVILSAAGCSAKKDAGDSLLGDSSGTETSSSPAPVYVNPLTGEEGFEKDMLTIRPVAIMINNIQQSLPQKGIGAADIVYEMPVEGPITRLMACLLYTSRCV